MSSDPAKRIVSYHLFRSDDAGHVRGTDAGRDQEGEGHAQGQARAGEAHENRDGRAGTEGRYRAEQSPDDVRANPVKAAKNPFAPLRWEEALNIGNDKNQQAKQERYLDHVIYKKLNAAADP